MRVGAVAKDEIKMITKIMGLVLLAVSSLAHADCMRDLANDPELYYIKDRIALGGIAQQTFGMLANESYPTSDEKKIILKYGSKREECRKKMNPSGNGALDQLQSSVFNASQSLILDLYSGVITYGQFARKRQDNFSDYEAKERGVLVQQQQQRQACANRTTPSNGGLFGPTPDEVRKQNIANDNAAAHAYGMMTHQQRSAANEYRTGTELGRTLGNMVGYVDPAEKRAEQEQAILSRYDLTTTEGLAQAIQAAKAMGRMDIALKLQQYNGCN